MHKLSFLVVNYHSADYTVKLCESISEYIKGFKYEILIADNSCSSQEAEILERLNDENCSVFFPESNLGFVKGNNYLLGKAQGDILVLINPDTLLPDSSLENACRFLMSDENIAVVGPYLLNDDLSYQVSFARFPTLISTIKEHICLYRNPYIYDRDLQKTCECDVVKGACLIIKKSMADELSLFDEDFVMYSEETDLCMRVKKAGKKVFYFPQARVIHYGERSSSQQNFSEYSLFNYYRSKSVYFSKHSSEFMAFLIRIVLILSLIEKYVLLSLAMKKKSASLHFSTLKKLIQNKWK